MTMAQPEAQSLVGGKAANSTDESSIIILVLLKTAINGGIQQSLEATYSVTDLV